MGVMDWLNLELPSCPRANTASNLHVSGAASLPGDPPLPTPIRAKCVHQPVGSSKKYDCSGRRLHLPILQMRKWRQGGLKDRAQYHTAVWYWPRLWTQAYSF